MTDRHNRFLGTRTVTGNLMMGMAMTFPVRALAQPPVFQTSLSCLVGSGRKEFSSSLRLAA